VGSRIRDATRDTGWKPVPHHITGWKPVPHGGWPTASAVGESNPPTGEKKRIHRLRRLTQIEDAGWEVESARPRGTPVGNRCHTTSPVGNRCHTTSPVGNRCHTTSPVGNRCHTLGAPSLQRWGSRIRPLGRRKVIHRLRRWPQIEEGTFGAGRIRALSAPLRQIPAFRSAQRTLRNRSAQRTLRNRCAPVCRHAGSGPYETGSDTPSCLCDLCGLCGSE
jgi:hypothetical protein